MNTEEQPESVAEAPLEYVIRPPKMRPRDQRRLDEFLRMRALFRIVFAKRVWSKTKPKPLGINTAAHILREFPEMDPKLLQRFMGWWTRRTKYLMELAQDGSQRYRLNGMIKKPVSEEHRLFAREELAKRGINWQKNTETTA